MLLGLDDGLHGVWLESGTYIGYRAIDFAGIKTLQIHLEQLNTTGNYVDGELLALDLYLDLRLKLSPVLQVYSMLFALSCLAIVP